MKTKDCIDCIHWHSTGDEEYQGYCYSSECSTAVCNHKTLTRFMSKNEVDPISEIKLKQGGRGEIKITNMSTLSLEVKMSDEDFVKARCSKKRQNPIHPDVRELTDESKQLTRKRRK